MSMPARGFAASSRQRAFHFRAGVRIAGSIVACDAIGATDLAFVSHAGALPPPRGGAAQARGRHGRLQILTTPETLTLMGPRGERLRARSLSPGFGRPFTLGFLRLELVPAGHQTGAASLLCDTGARRVLYAGPVRLGAAEPGLPAGEVRRCDALCIDAAFADPRFVFLSRTEVDSRILEFATAARASGSAAVFLVHPMGPAQDTARTLLHAGWRVRGDHGVVEATARYLACGDTDVPAVARFTGKLAVNEVLLCGARGGRTLSTLGPIRTAWVSEWAGDANAVERLRADAGIPASRRADFHGVVAYVLATGAREVALMHAPSDALVSELRQRNLDAYAVGPPQQIGLFERGK